jgi:hypothetical protein
MCSLVCSVQTGDRGHDSRRNRRCAAPPKARDGSSTQESGRRHAQVRLEVFKI